MDKTDANFQQRGLWRKQIPKDPSCLFRITSEFVYSTQTRHELVREECVQFMKNRRVMFKQRFKNCIEGDFDVYLENLANTKAYAGQVEMDAMSLYYSINYQVYEEDNTTPMQMTNLANATHMISLLYTSNNHYDVLYLYEKLAVSAFCQSLVYNMLYKDVFKLDSDDVDYAVQKMLYDKEYAKQKRNTYNIKTGKNSNTIISVIELPDKGEKTSEIRKNLAMGIPPFPYTSSKALDPEIYRNVELHIFNEKKREQMRSEQLIIPDLAPGVKCLFKLNEMNETHHVYIQEMKNNGKASVFIEELGEKKDVPIDGLTPIPIPVLKAIAMQGMTNKTSIMLENYVKNHPNFLDKLKPNKRKHNKKGQYQDYMFIPLLQSTSLLKLTQTQVLSTQNSKSYDVKNETKSGTFPRNFTAKNRDNKSGETKALTRCKSDYRETKVLQSTWSMAQASNIPIVANEVEKAEISTSELKNTCMTVSKVTKPSESKSTIVTKETKTTVKELNFKTQTPIHNSGYAPISKKPIISKPLAKSMSTLEEVMQSQKPPYYQKNDFYSNSVSMQQSYYENPINCYSLPTNCLYPIDGSFNYSSNATGYSYPFPMPYYPTSPDQLSIFPYNNTTQTQYSNQNLPYAVTTEVQDPTTSTNGNMEMSQLALTNQMCAVNSNYYTCYVDTGSAQTNSTFPNNFDGTPTTTEFPQNCPQNNFPVYVLYNPNFPIMYDNGVPQFIAPNSTPNDYTNPQ